MQATINNIASSLENKASNVEMNALGVTGKTTSEHFPQSSHVIQFQEKRPPIGKKMFNLTIPSEGTASLGAPIRFRLPKRNFIPSQQAYIEIKFSTSVSGPATPSVVQSYNMIASNGNSIQLLYNNTSVETVRPAQIMYESKYHQSQTEQFLSQKIGNEGLIATRISNNTANLSYYIPLFKLLQSHIHLPLSAYSGDFYLEVNLNSKEEIVQGSTAVVVAAITIAKANLIIVGHDVPQQVALDSIPKNLEGLVHFSHEATVLNSVLTSGSSAYTIDFQNLKGNVSHIVFFARDNAKFVSKVTNVLDKEAMVNLGEGSFELGTSVEPNKLTGRSIQLTLNKYIKGMRESGALNIDFEGTVKDHHFYTFALSQNEQLDLSVGQSSGSVMFDGTEQLNLILDSNLATTSRFTIIVYRPVAINIKAEKISKMIAK